MADMNLSMAGADIDWRAIAAELCPAARTAGCRCEYSRNAAGVPLWFPAAGGGIERKLITRCSRCLAIERHEAAVKLEADANA